MKKTLLAATLLLTSSVSAFAQVPDASGWKVGDEITEQVGFGNPNFTNEPEDSWIFERAEQGNPTLTGGCFEMYDGANVDLYQYIQLPAGVYKVEAQAYYRWGTSWDEDPNTYGTSNWQDNAVIYASAGTYSIEDDVFTATRTFSTPVMPRLFDTSEERLYEDTDYTLNEDGSKSFTAGWDRSDGNYLNGTVWAPASIPGSLVFFAEGKYAPYNDGRGVKYNTVTFYIEEDGYVKIGVSKMEAKSADAVLATNFKLYYLGEADEMAELIALQEEVAVYYNKVQDLMSKYEEDGGMIYTLLSDGLFDFEDEYGSIEDLESKDECNAAMAWLEDFYNQAVAAQESVDNLANLIPAMERLYNSTDYAGKAAFGEIIQAAKNCLDPDYEMADDEGFETFQKAFDNAMVGRVTYLMSNDADEKGAYDFTSLVSYPWFCNIEYEPTWNPETNFWQPNQAALDAGWSEKDDVDGTNKGEKSTNDLGEEIWVVAPIADKVPFTNDVNSIGQWYQRNNGLVLYWNDNLSCVKKWDMPHDDTTIREVAQKIVNVPNGYYSLKVLAQTWQNDWSGNCNIHAYIESGENSSKSANLEPGGWWGKDINQWKELETGMIQVTNGEVVIAGRDNGFVAFTGFRLFYYGETPNFTALLAPTIAAAKDNAATLTWPGDIKFVSEILNSIPATIESQEAYLAAVAAIDEVNAYVTKANAAIAAMPFDKYNTLLAAQAEGSTEATIVETALLYSFTIEEQPNASYTDAIAAAEDYAAYERYLNFRASMGNRINDPALAPYIAEQNEYLVANYANAAKIAQFERVLAVPYNMAIFGELGAADASEANPINITSLIINPTFEKENGENDPSTGWTGIREDGSSISPSVNEYGRGNAEIWNASAFTLSQKISNLPAGTYELRAKAVYRDGGGVGADQVRNYRDAGGEEFWANHNAELFMKTNDENDQFSYIKAAMVMCGTENSFTEVVTAYNTEEEEINGELVITKFPSKIQTLAPEGEGETQPDVTYEHKKDGEYPFDVRTDVDGEILYFPASMYGFYSWCVNNPEAVTNKVQIEINRGETLEIGIRKVAAIGGDWVIMDDFELFYLSGDKFKEEVVDIDEVAADAAADAPIYNAAGQMVDKSYKGIVIQNGVKFINK